MRTAPFADRGEILVPDPTRRARSRLAPLLSLASAALAVLLAGCSDGDSSSTQSVQISGGATTFAGTPTLWKKSNFPVALPDQWKTLEGVVSVNPQGCFSIGSAVIWAPRGSSVDTGGEGIQLAGYGHYGLGQHIQIVGGLITYKASTTQDKVARKCGAGNPQLQVASLFDKRITKDVSPE